MAKLKQTIPVKISNIKPGDIVNVHPSFTSYKDYPYALAVSRAGAQHMLVLFSMDKVAMKLAAKEFTIGQPVSVLKNAMMGTVPVGKLTINEDSSLIEPISIQDLTDSRFDSLLDD